jgi:hypothetical protein
MTPKVRWFFFLTRHRETYFIIILRLPRKDCSMQLLLWPVTALSNREGRAKKARDNKLPCAQTFSHERHVIYGKQYITL